MSRVAIAGVHRKVFVSSDVTRTPFTTNEEEHGSYADQNVVLAVIAALNYTAKLAKSIANLPLQRPNSCGPFAHVADP